MSAYDRKERRWLYIRAHTKYAQIFVADIVRVYVCVYVCVCVCVCVCVRVGVCVNEHD